MKIRITDIYEKDAHYEDRRYLIGSTGDLIEIGHRWRGWYYLGVKNQSYKDISVDEHGKNKGFGKEGDSTFYGYAKFEELDEG
jgi:hypothetical protein